MLKTVIKNRSMKRNMNRDIESSIPLVLTNKIESRTGKPRTNNWVKDGLWTDIGKNPRANGWEKNQISLLGISSKLIIETLEVGLNPRIFMDEKAKRRESDPAMTNSFSADKKSARSSEFVGFIAIAL